MRMSGWGEQVRPRWISLWRHLTSEEVADKANKVTQWEELRKRGDDIYVSCPVHQQLVYTFCAHTSSTSSMVRCSSQG